VIIRRLGELAAESDEIHRQICELKHRP
jgi:hypothetical protein